MTTDLRDIHDSYQDVIGTGAGGTEYQLNPDWKYGFRHVGFTSASADASGWANRMKMSVAKADGGAANPVIATLTAVTDQRWLVAGDVQYPKRGTSSVKVIAALANTLLEITVIERYIPHEG